MRKIYKYGFHIEFVQIIRLTIVNHWYAHRSLSETQKSSIIKWSIYVMESVLFSFAPIRIPCIMLILTFVHHYIPLSTCHLHTGWKKTIRSAVFVCFFCHLDLFMFFSLWIFCTRSIYVWIVPHFIPFACVHKFLFFSSWWYRCNSFFASECH